MNQVYKELLIESQEIAHLSGILSLLHWDQETYLPAGSIHSRSQQIAILTRVIHERMTHKKYQSLLEKLINLETGLIADSYLSEDEKIAVKGWYDDWKKTSQLPIDFVVEFAKLKSESYHVWNKAKTEKNYALFSPYFEKIVTFSKHKAVYLDSYKPPYDALLCEYEPGAKASDLHELFKPLKQEIITLLKEIRHHGRHNFISLNSHYELGAQQKFGKFLLEKMGFDFNLGRLDSSSHPFATEFHPTDVRLTARYKLDHPLEGLSGILHEGGHALYEQGFPQEWFGTDNAKAASIGMHESQSRLWENFIGKSKLFWNGFYDDLQRAFPKALTTVSPKEFYESINQVVVTPIRLDADELSYNLHIMIRFEIEEALLNSKIKVEEVPELWQRKHEEYLGVKPQHDAEGLLQDVHWAGGSFGYFPTYILGNIYAAQLHHYMKQTIPDFSVHLQNKNLSAIFHFLKEHVYPYAKKMTAPALIQKITKQPVSTQYLSQYLQEKYTDIYMLTKVKQG